MVLRELHVINLKWILITVIKQERLKIEQFAKQQDQFSAFQKRQELMALQTKQRQKGEGEQLSPVVTHIAPRLYLVELHQELHSLKNFM